MLYLDFAQNKEDFILESENKFPRWIKNILYFYRKFTGNPIRVDVDGKSIILISKFDKKISKKLDKIFKIDVTKNVCVCERLRANEEFMNYLREKDFNIMNGKWLFKYLVCDIAEYICKMQKLAKEEQEISILINEPEILEFETIAKLGDKFKNINVVTNKLRKFDRLEKEIYESSGLMLNVTNNFKNSCLKSKIIFNFDFDEKDINKIRFLPDSTIINLEKYVDIRQSNFKGKNVDFYSVNLPIKYRRIYKRLSNFNSSILYESFIYKKTAIQNIWREIENDRVEIIALERC